MTQTTPSQETPWLGAENWKYAPSTMRNTVRTAVPTSSSPRRPTQSITSTATTVTTKFVTPTMTASSTRRASSTRPFFTSHRGLCGTSTMLIASAAPGTTAIPSIHRQLPGTARRP